LRKYNTVPYQFEENQIHLYVYGSLAYITFMDAAHGARQGREKKIMNNYRAEFKNGRVITRSSKRAYSHAYMVTVDGGKTAIDSGFSSSETGARRAAMALLSPKHSYGGAGANAYKNRMPEVEIAPVSIT
jgi:hypothetical protein